MRNSSAAYKKKMRYFLAFTVFLFFFSAAAFSQQKTVTGRVTDQESRPLFNATVTVKGTNISTTTNADGQYSITLPVHANTLVFSYVGYQVNEATIQGNNSLSVTMQPQSNSMNEVVVIGYGVSKRKDVTGAVSSVTASQIEKVPVTTLDQALQGRAAGVQVINNDATPGGNVSVLIRGIGSLAPGGNTPLYVVDGYPTTGGINNINPNDIATIDVLKDASATAIYGIRAANGVVIITTKKGFKNKMQVSLDMSCIFSIQT